MDCPRIAGIVIARMDSTRLPGKVLADLDGRFVLEWIRSRAASAGSVAEIAVATTSRAVDDPIVAFANGAGLRVHRGDCEDVVARVLGCAREIGADWFFRLNGDSPFPDPFLLEVAVGELHRLDRQPDLISNLGDRSFPYGIAVELIRTEALAHSAEASGELISREHLTEDIYRRPECFRIAYFSQPDDSLKHARLVVDTREDLDRLRLVVASLSVGAQSAGWRPLAEAYLRFFPASTISASSTALLP